MGRYKEAAATALDHAEEITARLREEFSERHHVLMSGLTEIGSAATRSNGGMFVWAKYPFNMDDKEFVFKAIEQCGVVMVPGSIFGTEGKGYVRLALVQNVEALQKAIEQLSTLDVSAEVK